MTQRIEAGPLLVALGAVLLLVSLFLDWYEPGLSAWTAFEVVDLALAALAVGALLASLGLLAPGLAYVERRWLPVLVAAALAIVAAQLLDRPPAARGQELASGAWLALGATLLACAGAVLTFGRVSLALTVEGRDPRRRLAAVDARGREPDGPVASTPAPGQDTQAFTPLAGEPDAGGPEPSTRRSLLEEPEGAPRIRLGGARRAEGSEAGAKPPPPTP